MSLQSHIVSVLMSCVFSFFSSKEILVQDHFYRKFSNCHKVSNWILSLSPLTMSIVNVEEAERENNPHITPLLDVHLHFSMIAL